MQSLDEYWVHLELLVSSSNPSQSSRVAMLSGCSHFISNAPSRRFRKLQKLVPKSRTAYHRSELE